MSVSVPVVATSTTDGLAHLLHPGRVRVQVPVLLTEPGRTRRAWLEVDGVPGPVVELHQGEPQRVTATSVLHLSARTTVRLVVDGTVVTAWQHAVGR